MNEEKMKLTGLERVKIIGGLNPKIMEIADPSPEFYGRLSKVELVKVMEVGIKYQNRLIEVEMGLLKAQAEALGEMQKIIQGFK